MTIRITGDGPKITATGSGSTVLVEISTGQHDPGSFSGVHNDLTGRSTTGAHVGTAVSIDPSGFAGNLDESITNAQLLAAAVDDLTTGGGGGGGGASLSDATPQALGTAAAGTGTAAARDDHVHAMPTAADVGAAASSHNHAGSDITSGTIDQARLGTGSAGAGAKFLADDQTYKTVASDGVAAVISSTTFPGFAPIGPNHAPTGGSVNHGLGGLGREAYAPFFCPAGTYDAIGVLSTVAAVSTWRLGIDDNTAGWPGAVLLDAGTVNMNATAGWQVITGLTFTVAHPRWLWTHVKCVAYTASPTVQCLDGVTSAGSSPRIPGWPTYSSLPGRALVGASSAINSGSAGVLTAAGPMGPNSATQVYFAQTAPLILLRRSS